MFFRSTLIAHKTARKPYFMGLVVLKEIIFRKREYQEYITPQNFGSGVFFWFARHGRALTGVSPEHAQIVGSV